MDTLTLVWLSLLSILCIIFLTMLIVLFWYIIQMVRSLRRLTAKAEVATDSISDLAGIMGKSTAISAVVAALVGSFKHKRRK